MLWYFQPLWAFALIGVGFGIGLVFRVNRKWTTILDIISLGLGKMAKRGYSEAILLVIFAPFMAFVFQWMAAHSGFGSFFEWITALIYLGFVIRIAVLG